MSTILMNEVKPAVIPYFKERQSFPADLLPKLYRKLAEQDLLRETFHDRPYTTEAEFIQLIDKDSLAYIFLDLNGAFAGLAWLTTIEEAETLRKAMGSMVFFREFWDPRVTSEFGKIFLGQVFNVLGFTMIYGLTPKPNRMSRLYCTRIGFTYEATIPDFVSYHGKTVDAMFCRMTREQFNRST